MEKCEAASYLAAMIDGEGHVGLHVYEKNKGTKRSVIHRRVTITNTEHDIIAACSECLNVLGISFWITTSTHKARSRTCMAVNISHRGGFEALMQLPIRSERKRQALAEILSSYVGTRRSSGFRGLQKMS